MSQIKTVDNLSIIFTNLTNITNTLRNLQERRNAEALDFAKKFDSMGGSSEIKITCEDLVKGIQCSPSGNDIDFLSVAITHRLQSRFEFSKERTLFTLSDLEGAFLIRVAEDCSNTEKLISSALSSSMSVLSNVAAAFKPRGEAKEDKAELKRITDGKKSGKSIRDKVRG